MKVLDFGLAKAMDPMGAVSGAGSASHLAKSPTLTMGATVLAPSTNCQYIVHRTHETYKFCARPEAARGGDPASPRSEPTLRQSIWLWPRSCAALAPARCWSSPAPASRKVYAALVIVDLPETLLEEARRRRGSRQ